MGRNILGRAVAAAVALFPAGITALEEMGCRINTIDMDYFGEE